MDDLELGILMVNSCASSHDKGICGGCGCVVFEKRMNLGGNGL